MMWCMDVKGPGVDFGVRGGNGGAMRVAFVGRARWE